MADSITLTARYVFPVDGAPLERGLVTVTDDRIAAVDPHGVRSPDFDCRDAAIVPGFVNAHTHLDLSGARGQTPPTSDFIGWLRAVIAYRQKRSRPQVERDIRRGLAEAIGFGTTLLGDISHEGQSVEALLAAPVRSVVFRELIGLSDERAAAAREGFKWWLAAFPGSKTCKPGVSPHAPYSVGENLFFFAAISELPMTTHLAECAYEAELLNSRSGPFVPFLESLNAWEPEALVAGFRRILTLGVRSDPVLYAHANYLAPGAFVPHNATIVYCPRTHAAFGHPPHPFRDFLARGVRVALGTDSLASNPDLDVLAEARFIHARHPDFSLDALLGMATLRGAEALGFADVTGSLEAGKSADLAIVALPARDAADPHELLFASDRPVLATVFRGRRVKVDATASYPPPGLPFPIVTVG